MDVTVASFYTPTQDYPDHAARLRAECEALGVPCVIEERPDVGSWLENTCQKPVFLREIRDRVAGPMLWLDVDSSLMRHPTGLRDGVDFMARAKPPGDKRTWHVDVILLGDTPGAARLLDLWVAHLTDHSDEYALNRLWADGAWDGTAAPLPAEYQPGAANPVVRYRRARSADKRATLRRLAGRYAP